MSLRSAGRLAVLALAPALCLVWTAPARAAAPASEHQSETLAMAQQEYADDPFSAYGFCGDVPILAVYEVDRRTRTTSDGFHRHVAFTGTLVNGADTNRSVPYSGSVNLTRSGDTLTISGRQATVFVDGHPRAIDIGRTEVDFSTFDLTQHGQHLGDDLAVVCDAIS